MIFAPGTFFTKHVARVSRKALPRIYKTSKEIAINKFAIKRPQSNQRNKENRSAGGPLNKMP